jgi:hypothetical protein
MACEDKICSYIALEESGDLTPIEVHESIHEDVLGLLSSKRIFA